MAIIDDILNQLQNSDAQAANSAPTTQTTNAPAFQYYIPQQQAPQGMQPDGNFRQSLLRNFMQGNGPQSLQPSMSPVQQAQMGQMAAGGQMTNSMLDNPNISPNMQLYLQNLSRPSVYNQGLPPVVAPPEAPQYDPTSDYDKILTDYVNRETSWNHNNSTWDPTLQDLLTKSNDEKLDYLNSQLDFLGQHRDLDLRNQQFGIIDSGLKKSEKDKAKFIKDNKPAVTYPSYGSSSLWG